MKAWKSLRFPEREAPSLLRVTQSYALLPRAGSRHSSDALGVFVIAMPSFSIGVGDGKQT